MAFKVILTKRARKDLESLDRFTQRRIVKKLQFFAQDPVHHAEKLVDPSLGFFRFRIGSYRIIFDLDKDRIVVYRIGHRREIYR
jgi:mRNA interferase RelE/StbE